LPVPADFTAAAASAPRRDLTPSAARALVVLAGKSGAFLVVTG
jgi:hypothetical protein